MFGSYRYGSDLLNVTFDPAVPEEFASYAFDDNGTLLRRHSSFAMGFSRSLWVLPSRNIAPAWMVLQILVRALGTVRRWIGWQISTLNRALKV